jgi:pimeloyl-ACP methyl ester carboxylesterase
VKTGPGIYHGEHQTMRTAMAFVTAGRENSAAIRIYYEDHGSGSPVVLVAPLPPFLLKTADNPDGIDRSVFDGLTARIAADRPAAMKDFPDRSCNIDLLGGDRVSDQAWQNSFYVATSASAHAALRCLTACQEDFRDDLTTISIPVLVIHGDQDRILPPEATSSTLPALLNNARSTIIPGGPHAIIWTHAHEVNQALLDFISHLNRASTRHSRPEKPPRAERRTGGPADPWLRLREPPESPTEQAGSS